MTSPLNTNQPAVTLNPITGDAVIDALTATYYHWGANTTGTGISLTYSFPWVSSPEPVWATANGGFYSYYNEYTGGSGLTTLQQNAFRSALATWSAVADVSFTEVPETATDVGTIRVAFSTVLNGYNVAGWAGIPSNYWASSGDIWLSPKTSALVGDAGWVNGGSTYKTLVHELGHTLGLEHPSEGTYALPAAYATHQYSVMAFASNPTMGTVYPSTPMLYDIKAIQELYGANMAYHTGNDVYAFTPGVRFAMCIWDAGGTDTIDASAFTTGVTINLNDGEFSSVDAFGGANNLSVAYNCLIEDATGGAGNDLLTGNELANVLVGGEGNDTLIGGSGNDTLTGGDGSDTVVFSQSRDSYTASYNAANDTYTLTSSSETEVISGVEFLRFSDVTLALVNVIDVTPPTLNGLVQSVEIPVATNLAAVFSETVVRGLGAISLMLGNTVIETFNAASPRVTISGNTVTIDPTADLAASSSYTLAFAAGAVQDAKANALVATSTTFTTFVPNVAPVATPGSASGSEDAALNGSVSATDADGNTLTYSVASPAAHGTVTLDSSTGAFTYAPAANYNGTDSFQFRAFDGREYSNSATVSLTLAPVDDVPVAQNGSFFVNEDGAVLSGSLAATDIDGGPKAFALVNAAPAGLSLNANGSFSFDPSDAAYQALAAGISRTLTIPFTVGNGVTSTSANLLISITGTNDAPVAEVGSASGGIGNTITGSVSASDVDSGDTLFYSVLTGPAHGTINLNSTTGVFSFNATAGYIGADSFTYRVSDGHGGVASALESLTVTPVNFAPVALAASITGNEDSVIRGVLHATDANAADTLRYSVLTNPAHGTVNVNAVTGAYTYVSAPNYTGPDSFDFRAFDGQAYSAGATVGLTLNPVSEAPLYHQTVPVMDALYHFFLVAFDAAPGVTYMNQLIEAYDFGLSVKEIVNIFTTKPQFEAVYPHSLTDAQLAVQLTHNIVGNSASVEAQDSAILDIEAALGIGWSRGDVIYQVFGNLAVKPAIDPIWGMTGQQFANQTAVARYFTEEMHEATTDLSTLQAVVGGVTPYTDVSTPDHIAALIGVEIGAIAVV